MRRPYKIYGFAKTQYNLRPGPGVGPVQEITSMKSPLYSTYFSKYVIILASFKHNNSLDAC